MMNKLSYSKFMRLGRLGNQLFQLATLYSMSKRYDRELFLPLDWKYNEYFEHQFPVGEKLPFTNDINEWDFHFGWKYWDNEFKKKEDWETISVSGWMQSSRYWEGLEQEVRELFTFKEEFINSVMAKNPVKETGKPTILISLRVGEDYIVNGNYEILPISYQLGALYKYFPDWRENYNVLVFADDIEYAKLHLDCSKNIFFAENMSDIEQLCLGSFCDHFILSNSTFAWWQAYLCPTWNTAKVIYPSVYFKGTLATNHTTRDFWEKNWIEYDHRGKRFDLSDMTFHIPIYMDHKDRAENLNLVLKFLRNSFDTNIMIGEQGGDKLKYFDGSYMQFGYKYFHRTRMLNDMCNESTTPYIANYDADNICPVLQILIATDMLRKGAEMVYPYDGRCARLRRADWYEKLFNTMDFGIFKGETFMGTRSFDPISYGHMIFWNKEAFIRAGMENEHFISYGPEDAERWERANKLGIYIQRVKGKAYHVNHFCGLNSGGENPFYGANYNELNKIKAMTSEQLKEYVKTWKWLESYKEKAVT